MTVDPQLLERAQAEGAKLAEAERQVQLARAEYHTAVRRLHLSGASLRELADALGRSHQRVQQMVQGAGGSWWRRAWRSRNSTRDAVCTWCGRPPSEVSKLVAGPNVYICDACLGTAEAASARPVTVGSSHPLRRVKEGARDRCSFCSRRQSATRSVVAGPAANICNDCMRITRSFMDGQTYGGPSSAGPCRRAQTAATC